MHVSEAASITPVDVEGGGNMRFMSMKVGGPKHLKRPVLGWAEAWLPYLQPYAKALLTPEGQPIFCTRINELEKVLVDLVEGTMWSRYRWHSVQRSGAAAAVHWSFNVLYLVQLGCWKQLVTALEYGLVFLDPSRVVVLRSPWLVVSFGQGGHEALHTF